MTAIINDEIVLQVSVRKGKDQRLGVCIDIEPENHSERMRAWATLVEGSTLTLDYLVTHSKHERAKQKELEKLK